MVMYVCVCHGHENWGWDRRRIATLTTCHDKISGMCHERWQCDSRSSRPMPWMFWSAKEKERRKGNNIYEIRAFYFTSCWNVRLGGRAVILENLRETEPRSDCVNEPSPQEKRPRVVESVTRRESGLLGRVAGRLRRFSGLFWVAAQDNMEYCFHR